MTCETCRYWNENGQRTFGTRFKDGEQIWARPCQRFPEFQPRWFDDWCGEHTPKAQPND